MKTKAAVLIACGSPLEIVELETPALKPGQTLIQVAVSGVCHTQLLEARGHRGEDPYLPHCLGHEGSGTVLETGPGVTKVKKGDKVILSWMKGTGADIPGAVYAWNGKNVNAGAIATFNQYAVISENRLTPLSKNLSWPQAALLGCALPTGLGAVFNTAAVKKGESVAVFGIGGIGLSALNGALLAGAGVVIAVDINPKKLEVAAKLGATHAINPAEKDPVAEIQKLTGKGADVAIESSGQPKVMVQALSCVRPQGGRAVIIGNAKKGAVLELDPGQFNQGKRLLGTWGGDNVPDRDFPRYEQWVAEDKLAIVSLFSSVYPLSKINQALDDLEAGRALRPLIDMSL